MRAADYIVQQAALPKGAELDALNTKLEIIGESDRGLPVFYR